MNPSARSNSAMTGIFGTDKAILFGGIESGSSKYLNDTWIYDYSDDSWTKLSLSNNPGISSYTAITSIWGTQKVLMFGGYNYSVWDSSDTWLFDLQTGSWTEISTINPPEGRNGHAMSFIWGTDKVLLYGGICNSQGTFTWIFDLSENKWTSAQAAHNIRLRTGHALQPIYNSQSVLLFGGKSISAPLVYYDTWIYNLNNNTWIRLEFKDEPYRRYSHAMAMIYNTDSIALFGGEDDIQNQSRKELWIYSAGFYKNGTYASERHNLETLSNFNTISWDANVPEGANATFQIRTAKTELGLKDVNFVGPDGLPVSYYYSKPKQIWAGHNGDQWIQLKAFLNTTDMMITPSITEIMIKYNRNPIAYPLEPGDGVIINTTEPTFIWNYHDNDADAQSAFQVQISPDDTFNYIRYDSSVKMSAQNSWTYPAEAEDIPNGLWHWRVRVRDEYYFWGPYSESKEFMIDTLHPSTILSAPGDDKIYSAIDEISGMSIDDENGVGVSYVEVSITRKMDLKYWNGRVWVNSEQWLAAQGTFFWSYNSRGVDFESDDQFSIHCRSVDLAGNVEESGPSVVVNVDSKAPTSKIPWLENVEYLTEIDDIQGLATDTGIAGLERVDMLIKRKDNNQYWNGLDGWVSQSTWLVVDGTAEWRYATESVPWESGKVYLIGSRAVDGAGNVEKQPASYGFMFDETDPLITAFRINDRAVHTSSRLVMLDIAAFDIGSGLDEMAFSTDGNTWDKWIDYSPAKSHVLSEGDGKKSLYVKVKDKAGNIQVFNEENHIVLDTTPPTNLSIEINDGDTQTDSRTVYVHLKAHDETLNVAQMSFSFNNYNWTYWEQYSGTKFLELPPGNGNKKIYFRVKDLVGNKAWPVHDEIFLRGQNDGMEEKVEDETGTGTESKSDSGIPPGVIAAELITIIILVIIIATLFSLRLRDDAERETKNAKTEKNALKPDVVSEPGKKKTNHRTVKIQLTPEMIAHQDKLATLEIDPGVGGDPDLKVTTEDIDKEGSIDIVAVPLLKSKEIIDDPK
jgi:hypothetical protein